MDDLGAFLFAIAISALTGYCFGYARCSARYASHRPQRAPRYPSHDS